MYICIYIHTYIYTYIVPTPGVVSEFSTCNVSVFVRGSSLRLWYSFLNSIKLNI